MQKGETFLIGNPGGRKKHLWIVLSDRNKHNGCGIIVNLTTDKQRSGSDCSLIIGDHDWVTEECWVSYGDVQCLEPTQWINLTNGITKKFILPQNPLGKVHLDKIIAAAKSSKAFPPVYLKFLD